MRLRFRYFFRLTKFILAPLVVLFMIAAAVFVIEAKDLRSQPVFARLIAFIDARGINKVLDIFYLHHSFEKRKLPTFKLTVEKDSEKKLDEMARAAIAADFLFDENKEFVPATLVYNGQKYQVDIRYRGDGDIHWKFPKKSWRIRLKGGEHIMGFNNFDLIVPRDRGFVLENLNNYRAGKLGLPSLRDQFVDLEVNGSFHGPYWLVDHDYSESLEVSKRPADVNTYGGYVRGRPQWEDTNDTGRWQKYSEDKVSQFDNYAEMDKLLDFLKNTETEEFYLRIGELVDLRSMYAWQVLTELSGSDHNGFGNSRLYFDNTLGKFSIIPWDIEGGGAPPDYASNLLLARIFKNPQFLHEKNELLWSYVSDAANLKDDLAHYDELYNEVKTSFYKDRKKQVSSYQFDKEVRYWRDTLEAQFEVAKERFARAEVLIGTGAIEGTTRFDVITTNYAGLDFRGVSFKSDASRDFQDLALYFDSNYNGNLDSADEYIDKFEFEDNSYRVQFSKILFAERNYPDDYRDFTASKAEILPTRYTFFVVGAPLAASLTFDITNVFTGEQATKLTNQLK
ncbi:CotH kinase family protein [Patescibacteria group bacterium]|nr:CotH kinase family protein [Patescibacteria group bacterium]MBU4511793.1 CotH kinase family protein [Patescibacteria group bacterium]